MLSLVGEHLSGDGCGLPNHAVLFIFFLLVLFIRFILDNKNAMMYPVKQLNSFYYNNTVICTHIALVRDCPFAGLLASVIRC
jgi:hypothetical protein